MGRRKQDRLGFLTRKDKMRLNAPPQGEPWIWFTQEMLESGAYRSLSINARRALDRINVEHMRHAGLKNGRLKVTWNDFVQWGIGRRLITRALNELIAAGLLAIEQIGRRSNGIERGEPTRYRLTFLPVAEPTNSRPATDDWKKFGDDLDAARRALAPFHVDPRRPRTNRIFQRKPVHLR
jgi:hypothetical protein